MTIDAVHAGAAGTWQLGDLTVNRMGLGAMRLTANADGSPSDRDRAVAVLRRAAPSIRDCAAHGTAFVPFFSIVTSGREAGATGEEHPEVLAVAREHGVTAAQVRLAWTLARGPNVLAIPGTGDPAHLEQNVAAAALCLSPADLARLDAV
ncbi:aldo/keto reductase [Micromonospora chalcea]|uniref:aldo/keto reductase n=1 Tax=Micromonospora chalcea TaxID=1874 RepID=UPI0037F94F55